jgi:hypothetical protein
VSINLFLVAFWSAFVGDPFNEACVGDREVGSPMVGLSTRALVSGRSYHPQGVLVLFAEDIYGASDNTNNDSVRSIGRDGSKIMSRYRNIDTDRYRYSRPHCLNESSLSHLVDPSSTDKQIGVNFEANRVGGGISDIIYLEGNFTLPIYIARWFPWQEELAISNEKFSSSLISKLFVINRTLVSSPLCKDGSRNRRSHRNDTEGRADPPNDESPPSNISTLLSGVRRLPLSAKIGLTILGTLGAVGSFAFGFVGVIKGGSNRRKGIGYFALGAIFFAIAPLIGWAGP